MGSTDGELPDMEDEDFMNPMNLDRAVLRRQGLNEPLVPHIGGPYQRRRSAPTVEKPINTDQRVLTEDQEKMMHSIRAHQHMRRGRDSAAAGDNETAVLAFKAALYEVLRSEEPGDITIRHHATQELLRLMREESP
jgi:hypothetical protein